MKLFKKIAKTVTMIIISMALIVGIIYGEKNDIAGLGSIAGIFLGFSIPKIIIYIADCTDIYPWQESLRKLIRGNVLKKDCYVRISFAYLFRIQVDGKYLLVKNSRGTKKYQPVGGAYKYFNEEKKYLADKFSVTVDKKIPVDISSKEDYRLFVPVKYLKKFVRRFDETTDREMVKKLEREFREELITAGVLNFSHIEYRYCGRHFTEVEYSRHFRCYELLMADVVELLPTLEQEIVLRDLIQSSSEAIIFATDDEIKSCGIREGTDNLLEMISDHAFKVLQDTELSLIKIRRDEGTYSIDLICSNGNPQPVAI